MSSPYIIIILVSSTSNIWDLSVNVQRPKCLAYMSGLYVEREQVQQYIKTI
jgi:hypothetical protein